VGFNDDLMVISWDLTDLTNKNRGLTWLKATRHGGLPMIGLPATVLNERWLNGKSSHWPRFESSDHLQMVDFSLPSIPYPPYPLLESMIS